MSDASNLLRIFSPDENITSNDLKNRPRSCSISSNETTSTPLVQSLSSLANLDLAKDTPTPINYEKSNGSSFYNKLTLWKETVEKHLNNIYLNKIKEIDHLLAQGETHIDILFDVIPSLEQSIIVTNQKHVSDHAYDDLELDYSNSQSFDLTSNNILLCASDNHALIYDDMNTSLMLYNNELKLNSYVWNANEYGDPCDLTYSYYLNKYFIITNQGLFTWFYDNPDVPLHINSIKFTGKNRLWTIASTDTRSDVFVLFKTGSYIERWNSLVDKPSWQHIKRWSNYDLFERNDQRIRTIRMTSKYVAWTVESTKTFEWRVDLLDYNLQIIRHGVNIDNLNKHSSCLLSNFGSEQFLIIDSNCHSLFLMNSKGCIKLKNDHLTIKRIKNAVIMTKPDQQWLVIRLEQPNQLYFISLLKQTEN